MSSQWEIPKPDPTRNEETTPFWDGTAAGELRFQECQECGNRQLPAAPACVACLSPKVRWTASAGTGTVFSYTVIHHAFHPAFAAEVPYVVADIELDEGPILTSGICPVDPATVSIGMPVEVWFEPMADNAEYVLHWFRPAGGES